MSKFKGKKVLVVGLGRSGVAAAKFFTDQGAKVTITDIKQRSELTEFITQVEDLKVEFELGKHNPVTFKSSDMVVVSPGVPMTTKPLDEVRAAGIPITNEIDVAAQFIKVPLLAVTGTNGKTTTTLLLGEMFQADNKKTFVGGNVGKPLLDYFNDDFGGDYAVAEISSFQCELLEKLVPAAAIFTNFEEDHLDRYTDIHGYAAAKKKLLHQCDRNSYAIFNYDNANVASWANEKQTKQLWFTKRNPMQVGGDFAERFVGAYLNTPQKQLVARITGKEETYDLTQFRLFGDHNKENLMAAVCAARSMGVSPAAIQKVINEFKGVPHRLEFVRKKDGVFFFNDSKGTNVMSVSRSLGAFQHSPVILIAGGKDKGAEFGGLSELVRRKVKLLILVGEAKEKINRSLGDYSETFLVGTFEEAVLLAFQKSRAGDVVLLSPGCASQDMFRNFEERGDYFKKLVNGL